MNNRLVIFGTNEIADLACFYFKNDSPFKIEAFTVDDDYIKEDSFNGIPIVPYSDIENKFPPDQFYMHIAISYQKLNRLRQEKFNRSKSQGYKLASYLSSKSVFWNDLNYGQNCFILENQTIQPNVKIGDNVMIWSGNHIGHGTVIKDHAYISSHVVLSGHSKIGERCFLGVNSTIRDFCNIGNDCFIGMDAAITKNMNDGSVAISKGALILDKEDRKAISLKKAYFKI